MAKDIRRAQRSAEKRRRREKEVREEKARRAHRQNAADPLRSGQGAAGLDIVECVISKGWRERGLAHILIARRVGPGKVSAAGYYVDTYCVGLRNTALLPPMSEEDYQNNVKPNVFTDTVDFEDCSPSVAKALVEGAVEYAGRFGFKPNKRWEETRLFLDGIQSDASGLAFGRDGKPCLILRPGDAAAGAIARLERTVGVGNYTVLKSESASGE